MKEENISRRKALKILGLSALGIAAGSFAKAGEPAGYNAFFENFSEKVAKGKITPVTKRVNHKNGDKISLLGFGCMRFPTLGKGKGAQIDRVRVQELVDYAYSCGINYYDTAYVYHGGKSEGVIGEALKKYPRSSYFLADKMPGYRAKKKEDIASFFAEQLQRCNVDYFDYYLLHSLQQQSEYDKVYEEWGGYEYLLEQKKKGRIKNLGFSFHGDRAFFDYLLQKHEWDFVQIQLNYIDWAEDAEYLYNSLSKRKIPVIIMEPLLGGRLASLSEGANKILKDYNSEGSVASWAFRFAGSCTNVITVLSGMTYMAHLQDNIKTFTNFKPLSIEDRKVLDKAVAEYQKHDRINCTACRYCMPCPFGVEIPTVFASYNKGLAKDAKPDKAGLATAVKCQKCGVCLAKCPQHLPIPDLMERIVNEA